MGISRAAPRDLVSIDDADGFVDRELRALDEVGEVRLPEGKGCASRSVLVPGDDGHRRLPVQRGVETVEQRLASRVVGNAGLPGRQGPRGCGDLLGLQRGADHSVCSTALLRQSQLVGDLTGAGAELLDPGLVVVANDRVDPVRQLRFPQGS